MKGYTLKLSNGMVLHKGANPAICVQPDWSARWTAAEFQKQFPSRKFQGPGLYLIHTGSKRSKSVDSMLVVPDKVTDKPWKKTWHPRTKFMFYVWNSHDLSSTINSIVNAPTRRDDR